MAGQTQPKHRNSQTRKEQGSIGTHWIHKPVAAPRLLTLKQASEYLGLRLWSVRTLVWSGAVPVGKLKDGGRKLFIDRVDLERWLESSKERMG